MAISSINVNPPAGIKPFRPVSNAPPYEVGPDNCARLFMLNKTSSSLRMRGLTQGPTGHIIRVRMNLTPSIKGATYLASRIMKTSISHHWAS